MNGSPAKHNRFCIELRRVQNGPSLCLRDLDKVLRAEQGPCEPSKDFISQNKEQKLGQKEYERARVSQIESESEPERAGESESQAREINQKLFLFSCPGEPKIVTLSLSQSIAH